MVWCILAISEIIVFGQICRFCAFLKWPKWLNGTDFKMHQTIRRDPKDGQDELEPNLSDLNHIPTWYSKLSNFPIEIPIKIQKWLVSGNSIVYGFIKKILWFVAFSYLLAWAVKRGSWNFNFEVKRNRLMSTTDIPVKMKPRKLESNHNLIKRKMQAESLWIHFYLRGKPSTDSSIRRNLKTEDTTKRLICTHPHILVKIQPRSHSTHIHS